MDGVDLAWIETDGHNYVKPRGFASYPYSISDREILRAALGARQVKEPRAKRAKSILMFRHIEAAQDFLGKNKDCKPELIGFHGQSLYHNPDEGESVTIGKGKGLARALNIPVVYEMRKADIKAGGQGAPLLPLYHKALTADRDDAIAVLNIGGVSNITYIDGETVIACDTGPGNALIDDAMQSRFGKSFDQGGALASQGDVDQVLLEKWLSHPYFDRKPPKSLDRNSFDAEGLDHLSDKDAIATLTAFTAEAIAQIVKHLPQAPKEWIICGGGRHNSTLLAMLQKQVGGNIIPSDTLGWNGDAIEAEGWAYLAVRSKLGLPLSLPTTTGAPEPLTGGTLEEPDGKICISICAMDPVTGWCLGCGRSREEIDDWKTFSSDKQQSIAEALPGRMASLSWDTLGETG